MTALTDSRLHEIKDNPSCATPDEVRALCDMAMDARRYLRGFIAAMVVLSKEEPTYGTIPGLRAFAGQHAGTIFSDEETMRDVLLQAIGNADATEALATGSDLLDYPTP